jgi:hypothetical protein
MKLSPIAPVCLSLLWSGCFMVPSPYSEQLNPIAARYKAIEKGKSRAELEAEFGKPGEVAADGASVWETRFDGLNYTQLKTWFDNQDHVEKVEVTKAHGTRIPGYEASASSTRVK